MRYIVPSMLALVLCTPFAGAAEPKDALTAAHAFIGTWKCDGVFKPAAWDPAGRRVTEIKTFRRILGGKFIEMEGRSEAPKREFRVIIGWDAPKSVLRSWHFYSEGGTSEWTGLWDKDTQTIPWTPKPGSDLVARMVDRITGPDSFETTVTIKDKAGKLLLDVFARHTRIKQREAGPAR